MPQVPETAETPEIDGIDHVHIYVRDLDAAAKWYADCLGFRVVREFESWNAGTGPLTMADAGGRAHIALFEADKPPGSAMALRVSGAQFIAWLAHLEGKSLAVDISDHELSVSMYFCDPCGNRHEITSYDCEYIRAALKAAEASPQSPEQCREMR